MTPRKLAARELGARLDLPDARALVSFYGFQAAPFRSTSEPGLLWLGPRQRATLEQLASAVQQDGGVQLLTGEPGLGKTALAKRLAEDLAARGVRVARTYCHGGFAPIELFQSIAAALGVKRSFETPEAFLAALQGFLGANPTPDTTLVVLDEAQSLGHESLDYLPALVRLGAPPGHAIHLLLVGQNELTTALADPRHATLAGLITTRCTVEPLTKSEVRDYVEHGLAVVGADRQVFTDQAVNQIAVFSRGSPAAINLVGERALLKGHRRQARVIDREILVDSVRALAPSVTSRAGARAHGRPGRALALGTGILGAGALIAIVALHTPDTAARLEPAPRVAAPPTSAAAPVAPIAPPPIAAAQTAAEGRVERPAPAGAVVEPARETVEEGRRAVDEPRRTIEEPPRRVEEARGAGDRPARPSRRAFAPSRQTETAAVTSREAAPRFSAPVTAPARVERPATTEAARPAAPARVYATNPVEASSPASPEAGTPAREAQARSGRESSDPGAVIDWLLREETPKRRGRLPLD
jgi:general secretion pathway protein A